MLILDNVDDASFLFESQHVQKVLQGDGNASAPLANYLPVCDHGSILITTRNEDAAQRLVDSSDLIAVNLIDKGKAVKLLETKLGHQMDKTDVSELAIVLEGMPLVLS
jgi:hypothetical protein